MTIQPVDQAPAPGYPQKHSEESKQALAKANPKRWVAAPLVVGALSSAVMVGLSGCGTTEGIVEQTPSELVTVTEATTETTEVPTGAASVTTSAATVEYPVMGYMPLPSTTVAATKKPTTTKNHTTTQKPAKPITTTAKNITLDENITLEKKSIVPLFEYGNGTGSFGCVSVAAPVFFSEEEAFAIMKSAFAEAGVTLETNSKSQRATLPRFSLVKYALSEDNRELFGTQRGDLTPDGSLNGIAVEFVSLEDVKPWVEDFNGMSTVSTYPVKPAAQILAEKNPGLVVFYDPVTYYSEWSEPRKSFSFEKTEKEARAKSERELRRQVQAFVEWMNEGGA